MNKNGDPDFGALKAATDSGPDDARLVRLFSKIQNDLSPDPKRRRLPFWIAIATTASATALLLYLLEEPTPARNTNSVRIVKKSASVLVSHNAKRTADKKGLLAPGTSLDLGDDSSVDLALPEGARLSIRGPTKLRIGTNGGIWLDSGNPRINTSVDGSEPLAILINKHRLLAHDTVFTPTIDAGYLLQVRVLAGRLDVIGPDATKRTLTPGTPLRMEPKRTPAQRSADAQAVDKNSRPRGLRALKRRLRQASKRHDCEQIAQIVRELESSTKAKKHKVAALVLLAECHSQIMDDEKALRTHETIYRNYGETPDAAMSLFEAGKILESLERDTDALNIWNRYLSAHSSEALASVVSFRRCEALLRLKGENVGESCFSKFIKDFPIDPKSDAALLWLADRKRIQKNYGPAILLYRQYMARRPQDATSREREKVHHNLLRCMREENPPDMLSEIELYLTRFPNGKHTREIVRWRDSLR